MIFHCDVRFVHPIYDQKTKHMGGLMKRRTLLGGTIAVAALGLTSRVGAQQAPIKIGMSMPQTGGLSRGGKAAPLRHAIWRGDGKAQGGPLRPQGELVGFYGQT